MDNDVFPLSDDEYRFVKSSLYHLSDYRKEVISIDNHFGSFISGQSLGFIETEYHGNSFRTFNLFNLFGATLRIFKKEEAAGIRFREIPSGVCLNGSEDSVKEAKKLLEDILGRELDMNYKLPEDVGTEGKKGFEIKY